MESQVIGLRIAGTIFGLMCLGQLMRLLTRAEILIAEHHIPLGLSVLVLIITGGLSLWMWKLSFRALK